MYYLNNNVNKFPIKHFPRFIHELKLMGLSPYEAVFYLVGADYLDDRNISWSDAINIIKSAYK